MFRRYTVSTTPVSSPTSLCSPGTQLRASRTAYLASASVVGTVVHAETSNNGDQNSPAGVVPDVPAQSTDSEANLVPTVVEPEPTKIVFADLPEKVPFVNPFFSRLGTPTLFLAALDIPKPYADIGPSRHAFATRATYWTS